MAKSFNQASLLNYFGKYLRSANPGRFERLSGIVFRGPPAIKSLLLHFKARRQPAGKQPADSRLIAPMLRPILENFLRVAYPAKFPPGSLLGSFVKLCARKMGKPDQILSEADMNELDALREYANKFHHDTSPAWQTEAINDRELQHFCGRVLSFARRV